jgi:hypothetical protein
LKFLNEYSLV